MSVTPAYTGHPPAPKHSSISWWLTAVAVFMFAIACGYLLRGYADMHTPPPTPVLVTQPVEVTRIVVVTTTPAPTPRTVIVYQPTVVEVVITRVVYIPTMPTPAPTSTLPVAPGKTGRP